MTTQEVADRMVELNRSHDYATIYEELYAPEAVSIETWGGESKRYAGLDAIKGKAEGWMASVVEIHETRCSEALIADSSFAVTFYMDITYKEGGKTTMTELAVYTVKDGKVVQEEFQA